MRVGRVRTSAQQIRDGALDLNSYQKFLRCADCQYRWRLHEDRFLRAVVFNRARNERIAALAARFARAGQTCFVYVERVEHVELLGLLVRGSGIDPSRCAVVHGQLEAKENEGTRLALSRGHLLVVVGNKVWGEGTDVPSLRWVINGSGNLPGIALEQLIGRALRKAPGKHRAGFVDLRDEHDRHFASRSKRRLQFLRDKGFDPAVLDQNGTRYRRKPGSSPSKIL
jgi:superfamily II DNA or RNA helicase